ncbi:MAG: LCP family protein [Chloroflexi bacterium]|nr:LCP family protein [Chloroflexota bacterium]
MQQQPPSRHVRARRSRLVLPDWAVYTGLAVFVVIVLVTGYLTFNGVRNFVASGEFEWANSEPALPSGEQAAIATQTASAGSGSDPGVPIGNRERVTVLVMGIDERASEDGPWRTDTMVLMTIDPIANTAGILSIPRDLWVEIPDYDGLHDRINTAYFRGDADRYPGGGPALAMRTVQQRFGVPVDFYMTVNFDAFVQTVDTIGCIPIDVPQTIDDPFYPAYDGAGYDPFYIDAGDHCMNGETLLKYLRTRATFGSDFDRLSRLQQILYAIRDEVARTGQLPNLITQAPVLYGQIEEDVDTNLSIQQMIDLAQLAIAVPEESICTGSVGPEYVDLLELGDGTQVLVPYWERIRELRNDIFTGSGRCDPNQQALLQAVAAEGAQVGIQNGTQREGLASETSDQLIGAGINVVSVENADRFDYDSTIIYNYTGQDNTARYIASLLNLDESAIVPTESTSADLDIQIVLGEDYRP